MPASMALDAVSEMLPHLVWMALPDGSVDWTNGHFLTYTGLGPTALAGRGIGRIVHPADREMVRTAWELATGTSSTLDVSLRLRGAAGSYRWFVVRANPLRDSEDNVFRWFGTAIEIEERKREELALRFLADTGGLLAATTDLDGRLGRLAQRSTVDIADSCAIYIAGDEDGTLTLLAAANRIPGAAARWSAMQRRYPMQPGDPRRTVARTGRALLVNPVPQSMLAAIAHDGSHAAYLQSLQLLSIVIVPLVARGRTVGVLQWSTRSEERPLDARDLHLAEALAERVAAAIDNRRLYERERRASLAFQHAALPRELPAIAGLELRAVYATPEHGAEVGGDWYDAFLLPQGMLALSIGDVAGRGVEAAVQMSAVRQALHVAMLQGLDPSRALRAADLALRSEGADRLVTALAVRIDPGRRTLTYASAGHPPPFVRTLDGAVRMLPFDPAPPLGTALVLKPPAKRMALATGDLIVFYTDGLIESTRDALAGEKQLIAALRDPALAHAADPAALIRDALIGEDAQDDVAVLTLRVTAPLRWSFLAGDAMAAHGARSAFVKHLDLHAEPGSDLEAAELIYGELVGNVVRYAPGRVDAALDWTLTEPVLHLLDRGPGYVADPRAPADRLAESGRGLFICAALGRDLEVSRHAGGGAHVSIGLPVRARTGLSEQRAGDRRPQAPPDRVEI